VYIYKLKKKKKNCNSSEKIALFDWVFYTILLEML
jgi:hypothetical protein